MFWKNRRVFLTGHTGFKGSWLSFWLDQLGASVTGFSLAPPTQPSLFAEAALESEITSILGDIRCLGGLRETMRHAQPELLIHMAAQSLVRPSYVDPAATFSTNVMGTVNVLEAARACPSLRAILIVTSDKCYENKESARPYREDDALGGYDPYSNSKACAELVTACYRSSFFNREHYAAHQVAIASARAGNVIGGGDWAIGRLLPDAVRALSAGAALRVRNPHATRPWQHVLEPLRGYLMLAKALLEEGTRKDGPWNFGPGSDSTQTVESVVRTFTRCWNGNSRKKAKWEIDPGPHPHEAHTLALDCSRTKSELGWHSVLSFTETINMTAEWYCRHLAGESARAICQTQLARYQELAARPSIPEVHAAIPEVHAAALPHLARRAPTPVPAGAMRA